MCQVSARQRTSEDKTAGDEQDSAPDGTMQSRSGPQRPPAFVASERAGARQLQGLNLTLPSDPSRDPAELAGFAS